MERQKDKILIVDDVELNRAILCELFAGDYEILEADNGKTAVELMEQHHDEIAIVLMDIVMPVMSGLEALEIMNAKRPDCQNSCFSDHGRIVQRCDFQRLSSGCGRCRFKTVQSR